MSVQSKIRAQISKQIDQHIPLAEIYLDLDFHTAADKHCADAVLANSLRNRRIINIQGLSNSYAVAA